MQLHGLCAVGRCAKAKTERHVFPFVTVEMDLELVPALRIEAVRSTVSSRRAAHVHDQYGGACAPEYVLVRDVEPGIQPHNVRVEILRH
jgi:hypothetical protein